MVPSPVLALLLLFPTTDASAAASKAGEHRTILTSLRIVRKLHELAGSCNAALRAFAHHC